MSVRVVVVGNLKGGSSKTTSSAYLAHALHALGRRVAVVDADPQASAVRWAGFADWPFPTLGLAVPTLHRQVWHNVDRDRYDTVVIDTPPLAEHAGTVSSALRVATDVVIPMAPTVMEVDRLGAMWKAIEEAAAHRDDDPAIAVLLTRTVPRARSTEDVRGLLAGQGRRVFEQTIPRRESYAQAFAAPVPTDDAYAAVAAELVKEW